MMKKLMAAALGALACTPFLLEDPVRAAGLPCESELIAARPSPPTNLRILGPGKAVPASDPGRPGARPASATVASSGGVHSYYEELARQSDCRAAYSMRSQAQLDAIDTGGIGGKKKPVLYDSVVDAARFTIFAPDTTDTQQKHLPVRIDAGSMLLTWDFRFDRNFAWEEPGYVAVHKTWRLDSGEVPWLALKTDYQRAANRDGRFAELFLSINNRNWAGPGTTRGEREILFPRQAQFYFDPDTWSRMWIFVEDMDKPVCYLSAWAADENHDPIQLYERIAMVRPPDGITKFRMEYDTSLGTASNPVEMHSWNRNVVVMHNVPASEVPRLLRRPVR